MMKYDQYVSRVQRVGAWAGAVGGGLLAFWWGAAKVGLEAGLVFAPVGAFLGMLLGSIAAWAFVPHVMMLSLGVLAACAAPFGLIWLIGALRHLH